MYAYGEVNVCPCSAADRPSDDVVVEADLEQAPGAEGNFYIACCAEQSQVPIGIGNSKCLFSTYSYAHAPQQDKSARNAQNCSDASTALMVIVRPCGV